MRMKNKNNVKNVTITILSVLLILAILYIGYDKLLKDHNLNNTAIGDNCNTSNIVTEENKFATIFYENMVNNRELSIDYDHGITIVLDKDGNVYYTGNIDKAIGEKKEYSIDGYQAGIDENGKMSNVLNGYKLDISNVVMFFYGATGNGGWQDYLFVKSDGTVGKLTYSTDYLGKVSIEKFEETVSGYKNIIGIQVSSEFDAHGYKLIDVNGNMY